MKIAVAIAGIVAIALLGFFLIGSDSGDEVSTGDIKISRPWARATAPAAPAGAVYMELMNSSSAADRLLGAEAKISEDVTMHESRHDNGVSRMQVLGHIDLPPGHLVQLAPAGMHLMLMGLRRQLQPGQVVPLTLIFERADPITVEIVVGAAGAQEAPAESR